MSRRQTPFAFVGEIATRNRSPDDPNCRWNKNCARPLYRWPVPSRWCRSGQYVNARAASGAI
jgi:hypothetical protein